VAGSVAVPGTDFERVEHRYVYFTEALEAIAVG
jgi:hypothetical protein